MTTKPEMTLENVCFRYVKGEEHSEKCRAFIDIKHIQDIVCTHWWVDGYFYSRYNKKTFTDKNKPDSLKEVSPSDYLLLLSAPESQAHLLTEKEEIEKPFTVFLNEKNAYTLAYKEGTDNEALIAYSKDDEMLVDAAITLNNILNRHFKLSSQPPVMEGKKETLQDVIKRVSPFGTMTISNPKMLIALEDFIGQKTSSLQSEVEQLKGLLKEAQPFCGTMLRGKIEHYTSK